MERLLTPKELDEWLQIPRGRSVRLARDHQIPAVFLPHGDVRFDRSAVAAWLQQRAKMAKGDVDAVRRALSKQAAESTIAEE